ncbi:MAG: hypothetical protein AB2375_06875 [Tissierellaceae bacterium]
MLSQFEEADVRLMLGMSKITRESSCDWVHSMEESIILMTHCGLYRHPT